MNLAVVVVPEAKKYGQQSGDDRGLSDVRPDSRPERVGLAAHHLRVRTRADAEWMKKPGRYLGDQPADESRGEDEQSRQNEPIPPDDVSGHAFQRCRPITDGPERPVSYASPQR